MAFNRAVWRFSSSDDHKCAHLTTDGSADTYWESQGNGPAGMELDGLLVHQGVGEERILDCFRYDALSLEETIRRWKPQEITR